MHARQKQAIHKALLHAAAHLLGLHHAQDVVYKASAMSRPAAGAAAAGAAGHKLARGAPVVVGVRAAGPVVATAAKAALAAIVAAAAKAAAPAAKAAPLAPPVALP